ncbi:MAG TPA: Arm DNA-binding domain-containing protein [Afifellaceae bacterium]|nr:Arm DNA-binding domain-containing protein [Afifellaceae bacterium]
MPAPRKLTETYIRSLRYEGRPYLVRDTHTTGLMIAVNKKSKTFKVQRDLWRGLRGYRRLVKTVRHTIGSADDMSLDEVRSRGRQVLELIGRGIDPNAPTKTIPVAEKTVGELWDDYEAWLGKQDRSPDYIAGFRYHLEKYLSDWRHLPVVDLRKAMCRERHEEITTHHGKAPANQAM